MNNNLWCETYRPKVVDELILPERISSVITKFIENGDTPNMLFSGRAGTCKTSTAKAIVNTLDAEYLFINGSDETSKSDITNKVTPFASGMNTSEKAAQRIVILDECERLAPATQDFLKGFIEEYSSNCRFIFTCNTPAKVIEPIKSRCLCFDFNVSATEKPELMAKFLKRITNILSEKDIYFEKEALIHLIFKLFPDYRRIMNQLQSYSTAYGKIDEGLIAVSSDSIVSEVYETVNSKDFDTIRKWIAETQYTPEDIFEALYEGLVDVPNKKAVPNCVLILADYQNRAAFVANPDINLCACLLEIASTL